MANGTHSTFQRWMKAFWGWVKAHIIEILAGLAITGLFVAALFFPPLLLVVPMAAVAGSSLWIALPVALAAAAATIALTHFVSRFAADLWQVFRKRNDIQSLRFELTTNSKTNYALWAYDNPIKTFALLTFALPVLIFAITFAAMVGFGKLLNVSIKGFFDAAKIASKLGAKTFLERAAIRAGLVASVTFVLGLFTSVFYGAERGGKYLLKRSPQRKLTKQAKVISSSPQPGNSHSISRNNSTTNLLTSNKETSGNEKPSEDKKDEVIKISTSNVTVLRNILTQINQTSKPVIFSLTESNEELYISASYLNKPIKLPAGYIFVFAVQTFGEVFPVLGSKLKEPSEFDFLAENSCTIAIIPENENDFEPSQRNESWVAINDISANSIVRENIAGDSYLIRLEFNDHVTLPDLSSTTTGNTDFKNKKVVLKKTEQFHSESPSRYPYSAPPESTTQSCG